MKVIFITHCTGLYGANRSLLDLIKGLKQFKIKPFVICPSEGEVTKALERCKIPFFVFPFAMWMSNPGISKEKSFTLKYRIFNVLKKLKVVMPFRRLVFNLSALFFLRRQVKRLNVDIIYTNSSVTPIGFLIAKVLKKPHIWHIREYGWLDYRLCYDWGRKVFEKILSKSNAIIAISNSINHIVLKNVDAKKYVIYDGIISKIECDSMREQVSKYRKSSEYTFVIMGGLSSNKGQERAIRAIAYLKRNYTNVKLIIVGPGNEKYLKFLMKLSIDLEIKESVEFWGYIPNPFEAFLKADVVLMCSKYEALGRVTVEAMATSKPVIGYNNGGTTEIIEDEVTGLLYNGGYKDLAHCMERFVENPEWAQKLGVNGWKKAREQFTIEVSAKQVYKVLQEVTTKKQR